MKLARRLMSRRAVGWTPAEISTEFWLDASDTNFITLSGSNVTYWGDKSGKGRHPTINVQPEWLNNGVVFTSDRMTVPVAALPSSGLGYTIMTLMQSSATGNGSVGLVNINSSSPDDPEIRIGVGNLVYSYYNGGYVFDGKDSSCLTLGVLSIEIGDGVTSVLRRNGAQLDAGTRSGGLTAIGEFSIGYYNRIGAYRNGTMREMLIFANNTESRQKSEGYIAHRWDAMLGGTALVSALPVGHPYKTSAP